MSRRRGLIGAPKETMLGLVPGSGYGLSSSTIVSVDNNGYIDVTTWAAAWSNRFQIPLTGSLTVHSGDSVRVILKKVSGIADSRNSTALFYPIDLALWHNILTPFNSATIKDVTVTASRDSTINSFVMQLHANNLSSAFKMSIEIYINGKQVLK